MCSGAIRAITCCSGSNGMPMRGCVKRVRGCFLMGRVTDYASLGLCDRCDVYYVPADGHDCEGKNE